MSGQTSEWEQARIAELRQARALIYSVLRYLRGTGRSDLANGLVKATTTVLIPEGSNHWLKGVVIFGHSNVSLIDTKSDTGTTQIKYTTPEDRDENVDYHLLSISNIPPQFYGNNPDPLIDAGIHSYSNTEGSSGTSRIKASIDIFLRRDIMKPDRRVVTDAVLINYSSGLNSKLWSQGIQTWGPFVLIRQAPPSNR